MQDKDNDRGSRDAAEHQQLRASVETDMERIRKGSAGVQDKELAALKALAEAATPGPWAAFTDDTHTRHTNIVAVVPRIDCVLSLPGHDKREPNIAYVAAANPAAILSLIARIEAQAEKIAFMREATRDGDLSQPSPAVDLGGLTRYEPTTEYTGMGVYIGAMEEVSYGDYVKLADVQSLLSAPVVREGKMTEPNIETPEFEKLLERFGLAWENHATPERGTYEALLKAQAEIVAHVTEVWRSGWGSGMAEAQELMQSEVDRAPEPLRRLGEWLSGVLDEDEFKTADRMLLGAIAEANTEREVLATGKGDAELGLRNDDLYGGARKPFVPDATPSQAWNGELPEPFFYYRAEKDGSVVWGEDCCCQDDVYTNEASAAEYETHGGKVFSEAQVRKSIGAAVAGVSYKARALTLDYAAMHFDGLGATSGAYASDYLRSLKDAPMDTSVFSSNPVSLREKARADDFAKIVRATSGQQVLFFKEVCEEGNTLHCVANFEDFQSDLAMAGLPDDAFATALDKVDVKMADQVLGQVADLGFGDTASNGNGEKGGDHA